MNEARKLENQLRTLRTERSVAVLHYSPIEETIEGEPPAIFQYLGSQRLCEPIDRFDHVKAVVHGHAHHGTYEGRTPLGKPVYNVAQFVLKPKFGRPYALLKSSRHCERSEAPRNDRYSSRCPARPGRGGAWRSSRRSSSPPRRPASCS